MAHVVMQDASPNGRPYMEVFEDQHALLNGCLLQVHLSTSLPVGVSQSTSIPLKAWKTRAPERSMDFIRNPVVPVVCASTKNRVGFAQSVVSLA